MRPFDYTRPNSVAETLVMLDLPGGANRPLAGGTDLLTLLKAGVATPDLESLQRLLDLKRLDGLPRGIKETSEGVTLGALTTLREIETSPLLQARYPALSEAAAVAASPQLRNRATVAGNLLQRPRCWYFRDPQQRCWLRGGDDCPAHDGQNQLHALFATQPCCAVHPSDLAPVLLALDAEVEVRGPGGGRAIALGDFFALPEEQRRRETLLKDNELIMAVRLPKPPQDSRNTYFKAMDRKVWAFALVGVAAAIATETDDNSAVVSHARVVFSGVAPIPWRSAAAEEELLGQRLDAAVIGRVAERALADAKPLAHNGYKMDLLRGLLRQALQALRR